MEDEIIKKEEMKIGDNVVEVTVYNVKGTEKEKCSAHFTYNTLDYFLTGTINEKDFKIILENLYFL